MSREITGNVRIDSAKVGPKAWLGTAEYCEGSLDICTDAWGHTRLNSIRNALRKLTRLYNECLESR